MPNLIQRTLWRFAGANVDLLNTARSSWGKYTSIGFAILSGAIFSLAEWYYVIGFFGGNILASVVGGLLMATLVLTINMLVASLITGSEKRDLPTFFKMSVRLVLAFPSAFLVAEALEMYIFRNNILALYHGGAGQVYGILKESELLGQLKDSNMTVAVMSWIVFLLILLVEINPVIIAWFMKKGEYDFWAESNLVIAEQQVMARTKTERELSQLEMERVLAKKSREIKAEEKKGQEEVPNLEEAEFYIAYKQLPINELNVFFVALTNLYAATYELMNDLPLAQRSEEVLFKAHPEDRLVFGSIETGNSITFKVKTGWSPGVAIKDGDIEIAVPKGSLAFLAVCKVMAMIIEFGIANYQHLIEIGKLKEETALMHEQYLELKMKHELAADSVKAEYQMKMVEFYNASVGNGSFTTIKIKQDTSRLQKKVNKK